MSQQPSTGRKRPVSNVHLTKLSPHMQKQIKKPLLKRTSLFYKGKQITGNSLKEEAAAEEPGLGAAEMEHMRTLKPTLELIQTQEQSERGGSKDRAHLDDSKFSTTFGFSHGVDSGGVQVRKLPMHKQQHGSKLDAAAKDKKQMQICFSIASKASTMTQHMTESYQIIPNYDPAQAANLDITPALQKTPTGLASQLKIMEELGKTCRETPISIMESGSVTQLAGSGSSGPRRDATQRSLGYRKPDEPLQLFTYLAKQKLKKEEISANKQGQPVTFQQHQQMMKKLLLEQKAKLLQQEAAAKQDQAKEQKDHGKKQLSAKVPFIGPNNTTINGTAALFNTLSDFGKSTAPPFKPPTEEKEVPRKSLFQYISPGKSHLPSIVSFSGGEQSEELSLYQTSRPNLNNPLLPIQLNRKISVMFNEPETVTKKIQLPPQATIAVFDEQNGALKQAKDSERPMPFENHTPKWTKVSTVSHFNKKSYSVQHSSLRGAAKTQLPPPRLVKKQIISNTAPLSPRQTRQTASVPRSRNLKPNFLITSPSSLNKTMGEILKKEQQTAPFVGNYNVPAQPFTLPDGTQVQAKQLKNTFQRFKRELKEQSQANTDLSRSQSPSPREFTRSAFYSPQVVKKGVTNTIQQPQGEKADTLIRLADDEREALIQAVRHIQHQRRAQQIENMNLSPSIETARMPKLPKAGDSSGLNSNLNSSVFPPSAQGQMQITFAQMKDQYRRRGTFYQSEMNKQSQKQIKSQKSQSSIIQKGEQTITKDQQAMPPIEDSEEPTVSKKKFSSPRGQKSPSFMFQRNSKLQSSIERGGSNLMMSIERASPKELKQLLKSTIQSHQDRQWNESDLKIKGRNMGYPDHLRNLTIAQHAALLELTTEEEDGQMHPRFKVDEGTQHNGAFGQSQLAESQKDLNADLLLQNIYRSEEFFDTAPHLSVQQLNHVSQEMLGRAETHQLSKHQLSTTAKEMAKQLDENSENEEKGSKDHAIERVEASQQVNARTPDSAGAASQKDISPLTADRTPASKRLPQNSIKDLVSNKQVIGELDVETNYLRSSAQNFTDEMHLKTVFQKRAKPSDAEHADKTILSAQTSQIQGIDERPAEEKSNKESPQTKEVEGPSEDAAPDQN